MTVYEKNTGMIYPPEDIFFYYETIQLGNWANFYDYMTFIEKVERKEFTASDIKATEKKLILKGYFNHYAI